MAFDDKRKEFSRTRVWYVEIDLGLCTNTFGSAPCTAIGSKCYNTFVGCKDRTNFANTLKTYRFCSDVSELPFGDGERPYITSVSQLPTEIKSSLAVKGRVKVKLTDEPDTDIGIDPYVSERTNSGTYFKKLLARNPNFKGKPMRVYEGFLGLTQAEYEQRFNGVVTDFQFDGRGGVQIEAVDFLRDLKKVQIPPRFDINLASDITSAVTTATFTGDDVDKLGGSSLTTARYFRVEDEAFSYQTSNYDSTSKTLSGLVRGFKNTSADEHSENDRVQVISHYKGHPIDIMLDLLTNSNTADSPGAGLTTVQVDTTAFEYWRDWFGTATAEVTVEGFIDEEMDVEEAYFDLVNLMNSKSWVGEDLKITMRRNVPNNPGRTYPKLSDEANIVLDSDGINTNDGSRYTRGFLLWDLKLTGDVKKGEDYSQRNVHIDGVAESTNFYGEVINNVEGTRFVRVGTINFDVTNQFVNNSIQRKMAIHSKAQPILQIETEYKDSNLKTGEYVRINTDALVGVDGSPLSSATMQIIKREVNGDKVKLKFESQREEKVAFITPATGTTFSSNYTTAIEPHQNYGFLSAADSASSTAAVMGDGAPAYTIF
jgi:hypothetical protein